MMESERFDRRAFLGVCGAAAVGVVGAKGGRAMAAERAGTRSGARDIRRAVKYGMIGQGATVREKFALLRDLGFDGVELDSPGPLDREEVLAARDETGIVVHGVVNSVHWRDTLSDPDAAVRERGREALETAVRDCHAYGGSTVLLVPAVVNKSVSYADAYRRSQEEIRRVLPLAEELGITIAIENVWNHFLLSPLEAARYVDEFESKRVGWYFDVGNVVNYGWPEQWVRILGKRIVKVDVKEFSRKKRDEEGLWKGFGVELMEGDCDWPAVMKALDEVGYTSREAWMTAEIRGGDRARLAQIAERMERIAEA
jgi:L-ribulose-5-phosphate 3-epimerase